MKRRPEPACGQLWESRDRQYDPGRTIRIRATVGTRSEAVVIAYPPRPHLVGSTVSLSRVTLLSKWRLVEERAA